MDRKQKTTQRMKKLLLDGVRPIHQVLQVDRPLPAQRKQKQKYCNYSSEVINCVHCYNDHSEMQGHLPSVHQDHGLLGIQWILFLLVLL